MSFCTAVNCIDGRVQEPVSSYLRNHFKVEFVDSITEAGPNLILSNQQPKANVESTMSSEEKSSRDSIALSYSPKYKKHKPA